MFKINTMQDVQINLIENEKNVTIVVKLFYNLSVIICIHYTHIFILIII